MKITRNECTKAPDGYKYVFVKNDDEEKTYIEEMAFATCEGITVIGTNSTKKGRGYKLEVGP